MVKNKYRFSRKCRCKDSFIFWNLVETFHTNSNHFSDYIFLNSGVDQGSHTHNELLSSAPVFLKFSNYVFLNSGVDQGSHTHNELLSSAPVFLKSLGFQNYFLIKSKEDGTEVSHTNNHLFCSLIKK